MAFYDSFLSNNDLRDLWVSSQFILLTLFVCEFSRYTIRSLDESLTKRLAKEFVATFELCSCCFELGIIVDNYGINAYAILLFILTIWWTLRWEDATACPYTHIEDFMQGQTKLKHVLIIIFVQVFSGWAIYPFYVKKFWARKLVSRHAERMVQNRCPADLLVPVYQGALIEGLATCMCQLTGRVMSQLNPKLGIPVTAFIGTALVVAAFDMSGGYFNPVLATSLQYNCGTVSKGDHLKVYWCGAIGGSILSVLIWHSTTLYRSLAVERPKPKAE